MKFNELYRLLEANGWQLKSGKRKGGHDKYVHPDFKGSIIAYRHPSQEVPTGTLKVIAKQAGLKL